MIEYVGEHTFAGRLGNLLVVVSMVAAVLAALAYLAAHYTRNDAQRKLGRVAFWIHSGALLGVAATLFFMLFNKYFEYDYVWKHANRDMPLRYIFSCFWEGQEGSFILWSFWQMALGNVVLLTARKWENLTMLAIAAMQAFLGAMLLGIFIGDMQIGSSPFVLIRELPENVGLPWTLMPDYITQNAGFANGRGLNPLLQNYWMTIHPPTLFLGYASTIVPFAFALAGLWSGQLKEWVKPAIPWAFFSVSVLGLGILMGGAWAYEALTFGGFWAWDPVENASLVPWLTMVGAAHVMVVNQRRNKSLYTATFLALISYVLVMYASFLVHSGVLGDTSVHSFTGNGLMLQHLTMLLTLVFTATILLLLDKGLRKLFAGAAIFLLAMHLLFDAGVAALVAFLLAAVVMLAVAYRRFYPKPESDEPLWSREFWIFMGSVVLMLSAIQIGLETSKPVWNILAAPFKGPLLDLHRITGIEGFQSLAEGKLAPHSDRIQHFNKWQVPMAIVITLFIAFTQFLRHGRTEFGAFAKKLGLSLGLSVLITVLTVLAFSFGEGEKTLIGLLFTTVFAVVANADYMVRIIKGKWDVAGASVAHIGFAMVLLGALISSARSSKISENWSRFDIERLNENFKNNEDILLFINDTVPMGPYFVSYTGKRREGVNLYYQVEYFKKEPRSIEAGELVVARGGIFRAKASHTPGPDFIMDQHHWELVEDPRGLDLDQLKRWSPYHPGEKLFALNPLIQLNPEFGNVAEPSTKRYWNRDIYTHIRWAELDVDTNEHGYRSPDEIKLAVGDTAFIGTTVMRLNGLAVVKDEERERFMIGKNDLAVRALIGFRTGDGERFQAEPLFILRDSILHIPDPVEIPEAGLQIAFQRIDPLEGKHTFAVAEHISNRKEFVVMQAIEFPMINILWIGCVVMFLGTVMAIRHRIRIATKKTSP
jgi:cytochrome c-type biogenesis protein CcmF